MVGIHSGVTVRQNPASRHIERLLRVLDAHKRRRRLIDVAVPGRLRRGPCRVGRLTSVLVECGGYWRGKKGQSVDEIENLIHFGIHKSRQAAEKVYESRWVQRCGHQKHLA